MRALIIVDVQMDFCPGGALPVDKGDGVIPVINKYVALFADKGLPVFFSRDWHPSDTAHFRKQGGDWPEHCVQGTQGAQFHPDLLVPEYAIILSKGMTSGVEGYSAFQGKDEEGKTFLDVIEKLNIDELYVGGLATDYCVKHSVMDALDIGIKVYLLIDATKGVNENVLDTKKAVARMEENGANVIRFADAVGSLLTRV